MSTHTITIPKWVDAETIDWTSSQGGAPHGVYERDLSAKVTLFDRDGIGSASQLWLGGATDLEVDSICLEAGGDILRFGTPDQARAFARALLGAADEAESLQAGAK